MSSISHRNKMNIGMLVYFRYQSEIEKERESAHARDSGSYEESIYGHGPYRGNMYFDVGNNLSGKTALYRARLS